MKDSVGELYMVIEALKICSRVAPVGLKYLLLGLVERMSKAVSALDDAGV